MKILIYNETESELEPYLEDLYIRIAKETEKVLSLSDSKDLEVNVTITGNEEIREINRETRGIDSATDVLSFPMFEFEKEGVLPDLSENETILGDIIISLKRAEEQALEYGHSLKRELSFLFTHGLLHILGFDHINDDERIRMENIQRNILDNLLIKR